MGKDEGIELSENATGFQVCFQGLVLVQKTLLIVMTCIMQRFD
jgi:hypothetical protein